MTSHLVPLRLDFFAHRQQAVAVADRYPQDVFAEYAHEFYELAIVWRGNGLHVLNDHPHRIIRDDPFYIRTENGHSCAPMNDLALRNIIYCPERLTSDVDWQGAIPGFNSISRQPHWRLGSIGMSQVRQVVSQLKHESNQRNAQTFTMTELLFGQLVTHLKRHRYTTDTFLTTSDETLLGKLVIVLTGSHEHAFELDMFCECEQRNEHILCQQFRSQTGITANQYLRQVRACHAQYLLEHSRLMISKISMRCGSEDSNYLLVVFTRETGMTPSQWRHLST